MADNSHPPPGPPGPPSGDEPTPPRGELILPPAHPPAGPPIPPPAPPPAHRPQNEPSALDPEEFRQFQEFKQFQELMRQQREHGLPPGTPPPGAMRPWGAPPPRRNPVTRALGAVAGKIVTAVIVALLLVGAGYLAIDHFLGGPPSQPSAAQIGGRQQEGTLLFEENPRAAVQRVYDDVAQGDPEAACGRFTEEARAQFAKHFSDYGNTCEDVVAGLNAEIVPGQKSEYANPAELTSVTRATTTGSVTVSSCTLGVRGGPPLGRLTVTRDWNSKGTNQWIVTRHEPETCTDTPTSPPTS